jgi:hypothetical protein
MGGEALHLLVDSTGLKLCGAGEWLVEKHGTRTRRSWRKLHIGMDANTGEIVAAALTTNDVDDASQVGPLLDQVEGAVASFTGDGAYDQDRVYRAVIDRDPETTIIVPPRSTAVPSVTAKTEPTQRDRHLQCFPPACSAGRRASPETLHSLTAKCSAKAEPTIALAPTINASLLVHGSFMPGNLSRVAGHVSEKWRVPYEV